jgi:hypothetical protein
MIVVANTYMLNIFKQIPLFKMNLGDNFISLKEERIVIKDPFMMKYLNMTGKQILTYGAIGKLMFYQDFTLLDKEYYIFNDESIYGLVYTEEDFKISPENYLASVIEEIHEKEGIKENKEKQERRSRNPDIKLPADQYLQEMIKKRRLENAE